MSGELQDAIALAADLQCYSTQQSIMWRHECPFVGADIDEHDPQILECRRFVGRRFLEMQDAMAVNLDSTRSI